jgi:hypothetical protein
VLAAVVSNAGSQSVSQLASVDKINRLFEWIRRSSSGRFEKGSTDRKDEKK